MTRRVDRDASTGDPTVPASSVPASARSVAFSVLRRVESEGAYANLALRQELDRCRLSPVDRRFVTELVNGTTRRRRTLDAVMAPYLMREPDPVVRTVLRLGVYQLWFAGVAPHAAVGETVGLAPQRSRGFVNAVLRRVVDAPRERRWASTGERLGYPDWIVDRLTADLGDLDALAALERMNVAPSVTRRDDGYVQDLASQWVAEAVDARSGDRVLDVCAGPGGKATALAAGGASVTGADLHPNRARLVSDNARSLGYEISVVVADGRALPFRAEAFDRVLLDAPCSGLGALRRRSDARWRITPADMADLVGLQSELLASAAVAVAPGGDLVYSVCTLTAAESIDHVTPDGFDIIDESPPGDAPWTRWGSGWRLLPQDADTDGMVMLRYRRRS
jgi:16S rRNA (cytosine967-C5)-methyltransferase